MTTDPTFDQLVREALAAPFEGWDFSYLDGRKTEYALPWDYTVRVRTRMQDINSMLDMGTGGGEVLASLAPFPPQVCATEAYAPNVSVAKRQLEPLGARVYDTSADPEGRQLPFGDAEFDLIINRHEEYVETEVARLLRPGGCFVTQQCGGYGEYDLIVYFKGSVAAMDWSAAVASRQLQEAGLTIVDQQQVYPEYSFLDIGAVVYYLRAMPWLLSDFTVAKYRERLVAMHEHIQKHGGFTVTDQRFFIEAMKPV